MHPKKRATIVLAALLVFFVKSLSLARDPFPYQIEIIANDINLRSDSTVNSPVLCKLNKGQRLTALLEHYGWYKVVLPKNSPAFIKDDFVVALDSKVARVIKDRVNIRLGPADSSPVIGVANKEQLLNILGQERGWYRIEPLDSCFGWINQQFARKLADTPKAAEEPAGTQKANAGQNQDNLFTVVGIINPYGMVLKRTATHKIITQDKKIFLLKGNKQSLNALTYRKVKITGKVISEPGQKYQAIEVTRMELVD